MGFGAIPGFGKFLVRGAKDFSVFDKRQPPKEPADQPLYRRAGVDFGVHVLGCAIVGDTTMRRWEQGRAAKAGMGISDIERRQVDARAELRRAELREIERLKARR